MQSCATISTAPFAACSRPRANALLPDTQPQALGEAGGGRGLLCGAAGGAAQLLARQPHRQLGPRPVGARRACPSPSSLFLCRPSPRLPGRAWSFSPTRRRPPDCPLPCGRLSLPAGLCPEPRARWRPGRPPLLRGASSSARRVVGRARIFLSGRA